MKFRQILLIVVVSSICSLGVMMLYNKLNGLQAHVAPVQDLPFVHYAKYFDGSPQPPAVVDFTKAAAASVPAVVHIKAKTAARKITSNGGFDNLLKEFMGPGFEPSLIPEQRASGSGVLISEDGYIVTNNHVISANNGAVAGEITVTLYNRKTYKAKLVGRDVAKDIAVLKISETHLPHFLFGNSDEVQTGQWVLAIGYPLSLETTVTAGIVSATSRAMASGSRHINKGETADRSFIQTDAAVNTGNSGGALINTKGELIGINSGIISPTGTYAGYSFAIPINTVKSAVKDILQSSGTPRRS